MNFNDHVETIITHCGRTEEPFYVYFTDQIRMICRRLNSIAYSPKSIHFATMANVNPQFLGIIREEGIKVFVNSRPHLKIATECGFSGDEIVFTASALDETTMAEIRKHNVMTNLDSLLQVEKWKKLFPGVPFGLRCNIGDSVKPYESRAGFFIGKASRLGLLKEELKQLAGDPSVAGLHLYAGTDILETDYLVKCYREIISLADFFPNITHLDFGGGFGIGEGYAEDDFDLDDYGKKVTRLMEELSRKKGRAIKLVLEPGRIVGARAGYFVCRVTDVKTRGNARLVGVNASSSQFPRPLFYPDSAFHPVFVHSLSGNANGKKVLTSIYGCSTYSRDFLAKKIYLPRLDEGDYILFGNAGSYCASSYTSFLGFPKPEEIFI